MQRADFSPGRFDPATHFSAEFASTHRIFGPASSKPPDQIAAPLSAQTSAQTAPSPTQSESQPYFTVDFVPAQHRTGQQLYLENCATCHLALPPQVLPSETWRTLIQDESHYGATIQPPLDPSLSLIWAYLRNGSRRKSDREELAPYRLQQSQYFKALHPRVELPRPVTLSSCATCHPAAGQFNFRQLTTDWIDGR